MKKHWILTGLLGFSLATAPFVFGGEPAKAKGNPQFMVRLKLYAAATGRESSREPVDNLNVVVEEDREANVIVGGEVMLDGDTEFVPYGKIAQIRLHRLGADRFRIRFKYELSNVRTISAVPDWSGYDWDAYLTTIACHVPALGNPPTGCNWSRLAIEALDMFESAPLSQDDNAVDVEATVIQGVRTLSPGQTVKIMGGHIFKDQLMSSLDPRQVWLELSLYKVAEPKNGNVAAP